MITMASTFTPSAYQQAIYGFVEEALSPASLSGARRNLIISAVAGSGKSTTIKELLRFIPSHKTVLYLTFMREVNLDLGDKVTAMVAELGSASPQAEVRTCHSIGNSCLRSIGIKGDPMKNGRKYHHLCQDYLKSHMAEYDYKVSEQLAELVNKVRVTLSPTDEESLRGLISRYTIDLNPSDKDVWPIILQAVPFILDAGMKQAREKIDFTDQIWLPSAMNLQPARYDVVMIDEAQDLSPCIRELALKAVKRDGMVISVGDRRQAIMAFAGASPRSLDELKEATNALELPLNKNYRCPKSVIRLAQTLVPEIEAYEGAIEGSVEYVTQASVASLAQIGDMILCRYNAPLIEMAIDLIKMRKRCIVKGKDLGGNVTSFLKKVATFFEERNFVAPHALYADLVKFVNEYQSRMMAILMLNEEENENRINKLDDDCATLLALFEGYEEEVGERGGNYDGFVAFIENFFAAHGETKGEVRGEARKHTITLSTGHKAKGLENPNVFILGYDELPSPKAKTAEAQEQERNLLYVMITRPQKCLYCVVKSPELYQREEQPALPKQPHPIIDTLRASEAALIAVPAPLQDVYSVTDAASIVQEVLAEQAETRAQVEALTQQPVTSNETDETVHTIGRPRVKEKLVSFKFTAETIAFLDSLPKGGKTAFIETLVQASPEYAAWKLDVDNGMRM